MPTRVFEYGLRPPTTNASVVSDQYWKAHVYRNKLIEIEHERRRKVRDLYAAHPDVAELHGRVVALEARFEEVRKGIKGLKGLKGKARKNVDIAARKAETKTIAAAREAETKSIIAARKAEAKTLIGSLKEARAACKAAKQSIKNDVILKERLHRLSAEANAAAIKAREESGVYWGTYLKIEAGVDEARKSVTDPKFHHFRGDGLIAVQLQGQADGERQKQVKKSARAKAGKCNFDDCDGARLRGGLCEMHKTIEKETQKLQNAKWVKDGLCPECGDVLAKDSKKCLDCLELQMKNGLSFARVFGTDSRLQIAPIPDGDVPEADGTFNRGEGSKRWTGRAEKREDRGHRRGLTTVKIRVGSSDGTDGQKKKAPIWAEFPLFMHRMLPRDGVVKWACVLRERIAGEDRFKLQITVTTPDDPASRPIPKGKGMIAIDIGWRVMAEDRLRVAYWVDSDGRFGELALPPSIASGLNKADSLRKTRDDNFNVQQAHLIAWLNVPGRVVPPWLTERTTTLAQWRACARMDTLARHWMGNRFDGDEEAFTRLSAWRTQDRHLWTWEANQRDKTLKHRREFYRIFAAKIARTYRYIVLEGKFDLRQIARLPKPEEESDPNSTARRNRVIAAVSTLRLAIKHACAASGADIFLPPAAYTTLICNVCDDRGEWDTAASVMHQCEACGEIWDQDENAARNLLRACLNNTAVSAKTDDDESDDVPDGGGTEAMDNAAALEAAADDE